MRETGGIGAENFGSCSKRCYNHPALLLPPVEVFHTKLPHVLRVWGIEGSEEFSLPGVRVMSQENGIVRRQIQEAEFSQNRSS